VVVITDGQPDDALACRAVLDHYQPSGLEVMGIGIGIGIADSAVAKLFDRHIVINDTTSLQHTLFKLMGRSLTSA
jgi:uncharacterized protein YegL